MNEITALKASKQPFGLALLLVNSFEMPGVVDILKLLWAS